MENLFIYNIIKEVMSEIVDQLEIEKYILLTDDKKKNTQQYILSEIFDEGIP